ncbi:MAG: hypothetical protein RI985_1371, partial [Chloroflexota bacterium]
MQEYFANLAKVLAQVPHDRSDAILEA